MARKTKKMEKEQMKPSEAVQKPKAQRPLTEKEAREAFRVYFVKAKRKLGIAASLEEIIWMHLKATGHNKPESFEKGIEHFGYKL